MTGRASARGVPPWLVTVSGFCSGVGKTSLVELLVRRLGPAAALKVTVVDSGAAGCPIERHCGVCEALRAPYRVITERRVIAAPRKDTGRYAAAGAWPVVWVLAQGDRLEEALAAGLDEAAAGGGGTGAAGGTGREGTAPAVAGIVLEGNTPVARLAPDLAIMVDRPGRRETKPSAAAILDRIDLAVLNCPASVAKGEAAAARDRLAADLPRAARFELDLRSPGAAGERLLAEVAGRLGARRARRVRKAQGVAEPRPGNGTVVVPVARAPGGIAAGGGIRL